jgi:hypothetical protein
MIPPVFNEGFPGTFVEPENLKYSHLGRLPPLQLNGWKLMKLFTRNSRLNFEKYIIIVNHLAIHNTPIIAGKKKNWRGIGQDRIIDDKTRCHIR